jgi:hypothetical protein
MLHYIVGRLKRPCIVEPDDSKLLEIATLHLNVFEAVADGDNTNVLIRIAVDHDSGALEAEDEEAGDADPRGGEAEVYGTDCTEAGARLEQGRSATSPELVPIPPCSELGALRRTDANEIEAVAQTRETDVFGGSTLARVAVQAVACFDNLPALFQRTEIPSFARAAHDPETAAVRIECDAATDRK